MADNKPADPDPWDHQIVGRKGGQSKMTVGPKWYCEKIKREWEKEGFRCQIRERPDAGNAD